MPKFTAGEAIRVEGLNELRVALKAIGPAAVKELGQANKAAAELIASDARKGAETLGSTAAKSAPSLKSSAAASGASVFLGSDAFPFALGAEFGAKKYPQFKPFRGNQWDEGGDESVGYFLNPAIRDDIKKVEEIYLGSISELSKLAFPD